MNQSINTDSKNSKEPQQKYRLGTVSIKILDRYRVRFFFFFFFRNMELFLPRINFTRLDYYWIRHWGHNRFCLGDIRKSADGGEDGLHHRYRVIFFFFFFFNIVT